MLAFTKTIHTKKSAVALAEAHLKADNFEKGHYEFNASGKACSIGCMTHRHKLSGQKLRILEQRANGSGLFEDATGRVVCNMALVEQDNEYCGQHGAPAFQPGLKIRAGSE